MAEASNPAGTLTLRKPFDDYLALVLRGGATPWPAPWHGGSIERAFVERLMFHGVAGLLADDADLSDWPEFVRSETRRQAQAQAMWEMEHHRVLQGILAALDEKGIATCFLKGTASAYHFYAKPHHRSRGDTDLLIHQRDLSVVRDLLHEFGWAAEDGVVSDVDIAFQESWRFKSGHGFIQVIDLHWQALNSATLKAILSVDECLDQRVPIPSALEGAYFLGSVRHLLHSCLHRAMHLSAPYFVDGQGYVDNERLIWAADIALVAAGLSEADWGELTQLAADRGVSEACAESLEFAQNTLAAPIPSGVLRDMLARSGEAGSGYLLRDGRHSRAWRNFASVAWHKKPAYLRKQLLPPPAIMRARYPQDRRLPVIVSYLRRALELLSGWRRAP